MNEIEPAAYPIERLKEFASRVFISFGVPEADARLAANVLAASDLRAIDSHGVARLHSYFDLLTLGRINPRPQLQIVRETPSTATVDGDNGLGLVVGPKANAIAMEKAEAVGSGWVSVCNSNHFGIAGYYPLQALKRDLIGWAMTNSTKLVAPLWGTERMLGTNPIAIAFPGLEEPPIVIDMATSATAYGKIEIALRKGQPLADGWAIDQTGIVTHDARAMIEGGALLPLGGDREHGGHKGYGLAAMVDILSCVLSGANWGPFAPPFALRQEIPSRSVGKGIGHFFGALRIDGFIAVQDFKRQVDEWIRVFRATRPAPGTGGPLIPGDPEREAEAIRAKTGIPLVAAVVQDLRDIAQKTGIPFD
jgi:LDH2 family malate/lactate/ureidoglycolate dehydrogenase